MSASSEHEFVGHDQVSEDPSGDSGGHMCILKTPDDQKEPKIKIIN